MVILNGKIHKSGASYAMRVKKALLDANILEEGEDASAVLLSPNLNEEQRKFLDKLVQRLGAHMIAEGKDPDDFDFAFKADEDGEELHWTGGRIAPPAFVKGVADAEIVSSEHQSNACMAVQNTHLYKSSAKPGFQG